MTSNALTIRVPNIEPGQPDPSLSGGTTVSDDGQCPGINDRNARSDLIAVVAAAGIAFVGYMLARVRRQGSSTPTAARRRRPTSGKRGGRLE
jgi:hypothetical protein